MAGAPWNSPGLAQDLNERRLTSAVRPDQPLAVRAPELHGDVRKQELGLEPHGDAGDDDHWDSGNKKAGRSQLRLRLTMRTNYSSLNHRITVTN